MLYNSDRWQFVSAGEEIFISVHWKNDSRETCVWVGCLFIWRNWFSFHSFPFASYLGGTLCSLWFVILWFVLAWKDKVDKDSFKILEFFFAKESYLAMLRWFWNLLHDVWNLWSMKFRKFDLFGFDIFFN